MEIYEEFLLTAVVSILLAFLIGKLVALAGTEGDPDRDAPAEAAALPAAIGGGGEVFIEERRESVGETGGLGLLKVDDGCGSVAILGSGGMEVSEAEEEGERLERERYILEKAQEVKTREFDQEKENIAEETFAEEEIEKTVADLAKEGDGFPNDKVGVEKVVQLDEGHEGMVEEKWGIEEKGRSLLYGEDDWEGIEKSELEKLYGAAAAYADSEDGKDAVSRLSSDVQMRLYGLQRVATEGPCYEPQPMALKVAARSKWYC